MTDKQSTWASFTKVASLWGLLKSLSSCGFQGAVSDVGASYCWSCRRLFSATCCKHQVKHYNLQHIQVNITSLKKEEEKKEKHVRTTNVCVDFQTGYVREKYVYHTKNKNDIRHLSAPCCVCCLNHTWKNFRCEFKKNKQIVPTSSCSWLNMVFRLKGSLCFLSIYK